MCRRHQLEKGPRGFHQQLRIQAALLTIHWVDLSDPSSKTRGKIRVQPHRTTWISTWVWSMIGKICLQANLPYTPFFYQNHKLYLHHCQQVAFCSDHSGNAVMWRQCFMQSINKAALFSSWRPLSLPLLTTHPLISRKQAGKQNKRKKTGAEILQKLIMFCHVAMVLLLAHDTCNHRSFCMQPLDASVINKFAGFVCQKDNTLNNYANIKQEVDDILQHLTRTAKDLSFMFQTRHQVCTAYWKKPNTNSLITHIMLLLCFSDLPSRGQRGHPYPPVGLLFLRSHSLAEIMCEYLFTILLWPAVCAECDVAVIGTAVKGAAGLFQRPASTESWPPVCVPIPAPALSLIC